VSITGLYAKNNKKARKIKLEECLRNQGKYDNMG
jgi:hypothetical protein